MQRIEFPVFSLPMRSCVLRTIPDGQSYRPAVLAVFEVIIALRMALPAGVRVRQPRECLLGPAASRSRDAVGLFPKTGWGKTVAFAG